MVGFIMVYELNPLSAGIYIIGTTHFIRNIILFIIHVNNIHETDVATNDILLLIISTANELMLPHCTTPDSSTSLTTTSRLYCQATDGRTTSTKITAQAYQS